MTQKTDHPDSHSSVTHNIGAGLQRTICADCDYIGVGEVSFMASDFDTAIAGMAARFSEPADPWALELVA